MNKIAKYLTNGLNDPRAALIYLRFGEEKVKKLQVEKLAKALGISAKEVEHLYRDIDSAMDFYMHITSKLGNNYFAEMGDARPLYVATRLLQPQIVVETGVSAGMSSVFILKALDDEGKGALYSIDLPWEEYYASSPEIQRKAMPLHAEQVGFAIPQNLRERWVVRLGGSSEILPVLLRELGKVNIFLHDSEHS